MGGGGGAASTEARNVVVMRSPSSDRDVEAIIAHSPPCLNHRLTLRRQPEQDRICVVDMGVDARPAWERRHSFETPAATPNRKVIHLSCRTSANTDSDELVIFPEGAVEEQDVSPGKTLEQQ